MFGARDMCSMCIMQRLVGCARLDECDFAHVTLAERARGKDMRERDRWIQIKVK